MKTCTDIIPQLPSTLPSTSNAFSFLLKFLPNPMRSSNYKKNVSTKKYPSHWSLDHHSFIQYNTPNSVSLIMLDFDYISDSETFRDRFPTCKNFFAHFLAEHIDSCNFITQTNKGYQVIIVFENRFNINYHKSWAFLKHIKKTMMERIPHIDQIASGRNHGMMRNPLLHEHWFVSSELFQLEDFRQYDGKIKPDEANKINHKKVEEYRQNNIVNRQVSMLLDQYPAIIKEGTRTQTLFNYGMVLGQDDYGVHMIPGSLASANKRCCEPALDDFELSAIVKSVKKYIRNRENFVIDPRGKRKSKKARSRQNQKAYRKTRKILRRKTIYKNLTDIANRKLKRTKKKIRKALNVRSPRFLQFKNGSWNMSAISKFIGISAKTISKHMRKLKRKKNKNSTYKIKVRWNKEYEDLMAEIYLLDSPKEYVDTGKY
jgi:hypothetical protein